jgi:hypothetical protein
MIAFKILLVHNRFRKKEAVTYLSLLIRLVTFFFWNHIAVAVLIYHQWYVIESTGKGVKMRPYTDWLRASDRKVKEKIPARELTYEELHGLLALLDTPYGIRDLFTAYFVALWQRLFDRSLGWRNHYGIICSGLGHMLLQRDELSGVPGDFDTYPELTDGATFETFKS